MATKGVLGNDPFLRGAAARSPDASTPSADAATDAPAKPSAKSAKKASKAPGKAHVAKAKQGKAKAAAGKRGGKAPRRTRALPVGDAFEAPPPASAADADLDVAGTRASAGRSGDDAGARVHEGAARAAAAFEATASAPGTPDEEPSLDRAFGGRRRPSHENAADGGHPTAADAVRDVSEAATARTARGPGTDWGLGQAVAVTGGLASRALSLLGAARELAQGALAGEGLGRALSAAQGLADAVRTGLGVKGAGALDAYGKDATLVDELGPVLDFLYGRYWRVETEGAEHVPPGPCILVANHSGAVPYDGLVLHLALARARPELPESRWLLEDQVFHAPVVGTLFNRLGAVRACPENALRLLDERRPVLVFPEGFQGLSKPFAQRYQLKRFGRGGFVKLALRAGVPVVPVAVIGGEESSPLLARLPGEALGLPYVPVSPLGPLPLPAKWRVRFGAPLDLGGAGPEAAEDLARVGELTERTREAIQGMLESLLRERRSVFRG